MLSGGAAVPLYSDNAYLTPDLDFVCSARHKELLPVMQSLGFERVAGHSRYDKHPNNDYYLEFPPGPVAVGGRVLSEWGRLHTSLGWINILTPTQCVRDRLASYYAYKDPQSFQLALLSRPGAPPTSRKSRRGLGRRTCCSSSRRFDAD